MKPKSTFIRSEGAPLHCRECGRLEQEHSWVCSECAAVLFMLPTGLPSALCHTGAWLVCRRKKLAS